MQFTSNKSLLSRKAGRNRKRGSSRTTPHARAHGSLEGSLCVDNSGSKWSLGKAEKPHAKRAVLVQDVSQKREERKIARQRDKMATRVQSFVRGRSIAFKTLDVCAARLYKKVHDLNLLATALAVHKKVFNAPPRLYSLCVASCCLCLGTLRAGGWVMGASRLQ